LCAAGSACARRRGDRERWPLAALGPARDAREACLTLEIYLVRHGETEWSLSGQHTSRTDLPLTPRGEESAVDLKGKLAGIDFNAVFSSPMQRALETAQLAGFPDPRVTPLLKEFDYGQYEGLTSLQIRDRNPDWDLYRDGCPGGETPAQVYERARGFLDLAVAAGGTVLAFAHGHILRAVAVAWMELEITAASRRLLDVATINKLIEDPRGRALALWNAP
jgi:probable phosphoglycerate mutase